MSESVTVSTRKKEPKATSGLIMGGGYHDGSILANRLGLQFVRIAAMNTAFRTRKRTVDPDIQEYVKEFEREGMLLLHDFLPMDEFDSIKSLVERAHDEDHFRGTEEDDVLVETLNLTKNKEHLPELWAALSGIDRLNRISAAIARIPKVDLQIDVNYMSKRPEAPPPDKLRGNNLLHSDVHYPSPKAWLYLNDIDEDNGALMFAKRSHKMTPARLRHDYDVSVRIARGKKEGWLYKSEPVCATRFPTPGQWKAMGLEETVAIGKANSIVFADVMGFHRRGDFDDSGRRREQILFRFGDRPARRKPTTA